MILIHPLNQAVQPNRNECVFLVDGLPWKKTACTCGPMNPEAPLQTSFGRCPKALGSRLSEAKSLALNQASGHGVRLYGHAIATEVVNPLEALNNVLYVIANDPQSPPAIKGYARLAQKQVELINIVANHLLASDNDSGA